MVLACAPYGLHADAVLGRSKSSTSERATTVVEAYAGIRVRNPVTSLPALQSRLQSTVFFPLADVRCVNVVCFKPVSNLLSSSAAGAVGLDGQWATIGVLCQRARPRESDAGRVYGVAKVPFLFSTHHQWAPTETCSQVTDLDGTTLPLLAFGRAHEALSREGEGVVVALFDAKPRRGEGGLSISVGDAKQIQVVGRCPDFGICKALRKVCRSVD